MSSLSRNGLVGVGVTVGTGVIALLVLREMWRRREQRLVAASCGNAGLVLRERNPGHEDGACVSSGLTPEQHTELKKTLDEVMMSVSTLSGEVAELRNSLKDIANTIIEDVRKRVEEGQRSRRRRHFLARERSDSMSSSSVYFTASNGMSGPSEGGYTTAYSTAESDYTDRETDRDEDRDEDDEDEEEERSSATVMTLQPDEPHSEEDDVSADERVETTTNPELTQLLTLSDVLHAGDSEEKTEGFNLLRRNTALYGDNIEFLWRLARAYNDMCEHEEDEDERRSHAELGRDEAKLALERNGLNANCHKWFAMLSCQMLQYDGIHNKLKSYHILKEHLDGALALGDDDPLCFYLMGRWCYEMSRLLWAEQKTAAALYGTSPSSSLPQALENFLKAEELKPGFSRAVRLYIAKCHKDLGNKSEASNWAHLALTTPTYPDQEVKLSGMEAGLSGMEAELQALIDGPVE